MLQREHSAILSTFIKLLFVIKIFVLSIFEWPLKTGFTVSSTLIIQYRLFKNKCHFFKRLDIYGASLSTMANVCWEKVQILKLSYPSVKIFVLGAQKNRLNFF